MSSGEGIVLGVNAGTDIRLLTDQDTAVVVISVGTFRQGECTVFDEQPSL